MKFGDERFDRLEAVERGEAAGGEVNKSWGPN